MIRKLATDSFKVLIAGNSKENFVHANRIALVDRDNRLRALYDAGDTDNVTPEFLADRLNELARE